VSAKAELYAGPLVAQDEQERAARQAHLQQAESDFEPLRFDAAAARVFGRVAASLRRAGRKPAARACDAMIAAAAIAAELPIYTCNPDDLAGIDGPEVVALPIHPLADTGQTHAFRAKGNHWSNCQMLWMRR
jgi:tRNA(fMet)-specific endonuclease VapC